MNPNHIHTLAALKDERIRLKICMAATKKELFHSAGITTSLGRQFLFKKILLPAGIAGLGFATTRKLFSASADGRKASGDAPDNSRHWLLHLLMAGLPLVSQYFLSREMAGATEDEIDGQEALHSGSGYGNLTAVTWLASLLPVVVTLLQQFVFSNDEAVDA